MKKSSSLLLVSLAIMLVILSACQKHKDLIQDKEISNTPLPSQAINCRIESIWENADGIGQRFMLVLYDEYENPVAITNPNVGIANPYLTFKYDDWHRLREYRGGYMGADFEFLHLYGFDQQGRIGVDTLYFLGHATDNPDSYLDRSISKIEYDNQNRIIKLITKYDRSGNNFEFNYAYNAAGNLIYPDNSGKTYDNKLNLYRTNDIWMFLSRDYSINNPFTADAYNSMGFPTVINPGYLTTFIFLYHSIRLNNSQISYSCRQANW